MSRPVWEEALIEALKLRGSVRKVAPFVDVDRRTVTRHMKADPSLADRVKAAIAEHKAAERERESQRRVRQVRHLLRRHGSY